ncbi:MAG TPA: alanine dehydrogenase [Gammaproteobacteria bacterium]
MIVGVPKERKTHEYRVGLTPGSARELIEQGHHVLVESGAALGIGLPDAAYAKVGATIAPTAEEVYANSELIVKVKEPTEAESKLLGEGQILFAYLHLAPNRAEADLLLESGVTAIAYETVTGPNNTLPLLAPMSEIAGRLAVQAGAHCLERPQGGHGTLLSGVPGVPPGNVLIIGGGIVGDNAAHMACGMGADVTVLDRSIPRLRQLADHYGGAVKCVYSTSQTIERYALQADLIIGAVLIPGATAPRVVSGALVKRMRPGTVLVDVSIDQGGCFETSRPTTHDAPTYTVEGVVHYCVTNMPGIVPRTATLALNNATLPYVTALARHGLAEALRLDPGLADGVNIHAGRVTHPAVARDLGYEHHPIATLL